MSEDRKELFRRAWEVIQQDTSVSAEDKGKLLKLIRALIEAAETTPDAADVSAEQTTREIISKHSLIALVKQQADELDALKSISRNLTSSLDLQTVLDAVVAEAMRLVRHARTAHIYLYLNGHLEFGASLTTNGEKNKPFAAPRPHGLTSSVVQSGSQIIVEDILSHPLYAGAPNDWAGSIIGIPLKFGNSIVGVMNLSRSIVGKFTNSELRLLGLLADQAAVAISNARLHKFMMEMANTDSVTGLPNRRALDERLQEEFRYAQRMGSPFSVVMMDLDGFKTVNDTYGHDVGDKLLHSLFNFLARHIRNSDFLARYGGDELTLVMHNTDLPAAETVTKKMIGLMTEYRFSQRANTPLKLGLTAGIATYPNHAHTPSDLLRAADAALYHAKKYYRGSFAVAKEATGMLNASRVTGNPPDKTN